MRYRRFTAVVVSAAALAASSQALAADPAAAAAEDPAVSQIKSEQGEKILAAKTFRTSKLTGMSVRNMQGEELGTIYDIVVDVETGKVQYVALSVGGLLGVGDKLFAVPFSQVKFDHGQDEMFFVLDMPSKELAAAPGFNQNDWPDFADPSWKAKLDKHYRKTEIRTGAEENRNDRARDADNRIDN